MTILINRVKKLIPKSETEDREVGLLQDDAGRDVAEVWWDAKSKGCFIKLLIDSPQVTCKGYTLDNNKILQPYANNAHNLTVNDTFKFTVPVDSVVNSDYWSNNCSVWLDNISCVSFDFNLISNSDTMYQLLGSALEVGV